MRFGRILLLTNGTLFTLFGLCFIVAPGFFFALFTGDSFTTGSATTDVRATYGGVCLGVGIWFFLCVNTHVRFGLLGLLVVLASVVVGRLVGMALADDLNIVMYISLALETGFLVPTVFALLTYREQSG